MTEDEQHAYYCYFTTKDTGLNCVMMEGCSSINEAINYVKESCSVDRVMVSIQGGNQ